MKKIFLILVVMFISLSASKFLMPDEAFSPSLKVDNSDIVVDIKLGKDIYLYSKKVKLYLKNNKDITLEKVKSPKIEKLHGDDVYLKSPTFVYSMQNLKSKDIKKLKFILEYQGCSQAGICYEPFKKEYEVEVDFSKSKIKDIKLDTLNIKDEKKELSKTDSIAQTIKDGNIAIIILTFLGFGFLLSLTPCVFPMIPIISGVIVSQGKGITTTKAFMLSLVYVLSMSVAYTIAGILAGLFGANLQAMLQNEWVIYSFSAIFVALAFSMFGFYELKLPDTLVAKVSKNSQKTGYVGVAIMGFLSALIVGPCVAAPLAGALVYIGQTGDALLGGMALFSMSIGMGIPLIIVGVSAGRFMPKPGAWMNLVSAVFGVMMLAVAIWMLDRVVDISVIMFLSVSLGVGFSLYLGLFENGIHFVKKTVAILIFIYSVSLFVSLLSGSCSMLKPLSFLKSTKTMQKESSLEDRFIRVTSISELDSVLKKYKGQKIMVDFCADWCVSCKELDEVTFKDTKVISALKDFVLVKADVTANSVENKNLSKKYRVFAPPTIIFFNKKSVFNTSNSLVGFVKPQEFENHLLKL